MRFFLKVFTDDEKDFLIKEINQETAVFINENSMVYIDESISGLVLNTNIVDIQKNTIEMILKPYDQDNIKKEDVEYFLKNGWEKVKA